MRTEQAQDWRRSKSKVRWKSLTLALCAFPFIHFIHTNTFTRTHARTQTATSIAGLFSYLHKQDTGKG